jgi:probable F420-dependent oxidoreductase
MPAPVDLGPIGLWTFAFDQMPYGQAREVAAEVESLGYGAIWVPEAVGKDPLVNSALLLGATQRITLATGIASIYARDAMAMAQGAKTVAEAFPGRFVLGLGVSHRPMVEDMRGHEYASPVRTMRGYLDRMDGALYFGAAPAVEPAIVIGALGPKMTELAGERTSGVHPYNVTPEHNAAARALIGPDRLIATELAVVRTTDAEAARAAGRGHLAMYLSLPNYTNNLLRLGFTEADLDGGGSDRLIDALVAWGSDETIAARIAEHHAAGADHVCLQVLAAEPVAEWRALAPALFG